MPNINVNYKATPLAIIAILNQVIKAGREVYADGKANNTTQAAVET